MSLCFSSAGIRRIARCAWILLLASGLAACAHGPRDVYVGKGMFGDIIVYDDAQGLRTLEFERGGGRQTVARPGDPTHLELTAVLGTSLSAHHILGLKPVPRVWLFAI